MKVRYLFNSLLLVVSSALAASAFNATFLANKDNTLFEQTDPNAQTSSALGDLFAGRINQPANSIRRGLVQFNIGAAVPSGSTITSVTLDLGEVQFSNGDQDVSLYRLNENWGSGNSLSAGGAGAAATFGDATWLYAFYSPLPAARVPWSTAGGAYAATPSATASVVDDFGAAHVFNWSSAGMVADVQAWSDNPATNFGWAIVGNEAVPQTVKRFSSFETGAVRIFRPTLHVTYVPEPATALLVTVVVSGYLFVRRRPQPL